MKSLSLALLATTSFIFLGCSTASCDNKKPSAQATAPTQGAVMIQTVKVYKSDGTLQCGQGKEIALDVMAKDLGDIKVLKSEKKNDGMMRMQVCGAPTGNHNVYEINKDDLSKALKLGFKQWSFSAE